MRMTNGKDGGDRIRSDFIFQPPPHTTTTTLSLSPIYFPQYKNPSPLPSYTRFSETETQLEKNVGLGPCFHISGAVCAPNSWAAVSGSRAAPVCRVWEFSHQWCFYYGPFSPLLCSRLCLLDCC